MQPAQRCDLVRDAMRELHLILTKMLSRLRPQPGRQVIATWRSPLQPAPRTDAHVTRFWGLVRKMATQREEKLDAAMVPRRSNASGFDGLEVHSEWRKA